MAKKKKTQAPPRDFRNSPFKELKGLAVSGEEPPPVKQKPQTDSPAPEEVVDDAALFEREMRMLQVEKNSDGGMGRPLPLEPPDGAPDGAARKTEVVSDQDLFLESIGNMDSVFRDAVPEDDKPHAAPRRMRQLRQGKLVPEAQLDLHGASREQARQKVRFFLEDSIYQGCKTVLIITGRGKGSQDGPVLRDDVENFLAHEAQAWVIEWDRAPAQYGGEGALVAFLRSSRKM